METFSHHITKDDSDIIRIASFIADKGLNGATSEELIIYYHQHNQLTNEERDELIKYFHFYNRDPLLKVDLHEKFMRLVFILDNGSSFNRDDNKITITFEGISSLLDFIELKHARRNAREARTFSAWAIGISVLALIVSSVFGYMQLNNKVEIEDSQLEYLHEKSDYSTKFDAITLELKRMNNHFDTLKNNMSILKDKKGVRINGW